MSGNKTEEVSKETERDPGGYAMLETKDCRVWRNKISTMSNARKRTYKIKQWKAATGFCIQKITDDLREGKFHKELKVDFSYSWLKSKRR